MEAGKRTIELIFNKGRSLEIPFFQRSYVWKTENWERFMNDMVMVSKSNNEYFMGSLILKSHQVSSEKNIGDWRIVIDGQQRLTTIILFFKVICSIKKNTTLFKDTFFNRSKEIILKHNHNDYKIFEAIINDKVSDELKEKYKNNNVLNCYNYFVKQRDLLKEIDINNILDRLYFVGIDLGSEEDEQQIFDTINSLGVSLTTAELLKNELYKRSDEKFYENTWKKAFEQDEDIKDYWDQKVTSGRQFRINIDLLLQSNLLIISKADTNYLGLSSLFKNYKTFLKKKESDKKKFINALIKYAEIYKKNINPDLLNQDINVKSSMERFNLVIFGLNVTTIIPYVLYILNEVKESPEKDKMLNLLECYLIRRFICKETTKNYNNLFASFIRNNINSYEKLSKKIFEADDPTNKLPTDANLKKAFFESNLTNQQAKVVLYLIEKSTRDSKNYSTNLRPLNEYSLEHIMPKKWRNNWKVPDLFSEKDREKRDQLLLKLGNLTIITASLNSSIRDASWQIKKNGNGDKKGLKEYSAGISIFEKCLSYSEWNEEKIDERGNELFELSKEVWKYNKE
jgi:uncharacterized protein with ParB-like and HNH nuclease domain|tara:strand:- start:53 stop:1759 length:1707 start_codon:yes stop_codon:yes gene_type:complete